MAKEQLKDEAAPALVVSHLTKRFGDRSAFEDVSFEVAHGEVFGFLGPNGAGKTTTVRTLGTLIAPTSGSAVVAGIPLSAATGAEIRQLISVMPENPGLYVRLTVQENLELFAGLYGLPSPAARIAAALETVGGGAHQARPLDHPQARVAMGCAGGAGDGNGQPAQRVTVPPWSTSRLGSPRALSQPGASTPRTIAAVEAVLASTHEAATTVTVRQGPSEGIPVRGSKMWWRDNVPRVQRLTVVLEVATPPD